MKKPSQVKSAADKAAPEDDIKEDVCPHDAGSQAAMLCEKTKAMRMLPMIIKTSPFISADAGGFWVISNLSSRAQILPNKGVYQRKPRIKFATTAITIAHGLMWMF